MEAVYVLSAGLEVFFAIISGILVLACFFDNDRKRMTNRMFMGMLLINIVMNLTDACIWLWVDVLEVQLLMRVLSFVSYTMGALLFAMFSFLVVSYIQEYVALPRWIFCGLSACTVVMLCTWFIAIFNDMFYYWDENGICQYGELFWLSQLYGILFLISNIVLLFIYRKHIEKKECIVLVMYNVLPMLSFGITFWLKWEATPLYAAATISMLLYYAVIHVEHGQRVAEQETKLVKQELELVSSRTAIMLSQIQPHFLYNSLTAIAQLCEKQPQKAKEMTLSFSEYLRQNMSSLDQKAPIPFSQALEHLKIYLSIEQVRFGSLLNVIYDIEVKDFMIPALCLQPIVENAVKHGIRRNEDGGTVTISTREKMDGYLITVKDNGAGFDPSVKPDDGRTHIGITNVKERLSVLVNGTMEIESSIGEGTVVHIMIPKGEMT